MTYFAQHMKARYKCETPNESSALKALIFLLNQQTVETLCALTAILDGGKYEGV